MSIQKFSADDRELGLDVSITRRDFLDSAMLGAGMALLTRHAPVFGAGTEGAANVRDAAEFNGYGGVGDYAPAHGNMWEVVDTAHAMRDGRFRTIPDALETDETHDVIVVGGGLAGLSAAHRVLDLGGGSRKCLVLENHRMWGGESRRNEFLVGAVRLHAAQGANEFHPPHTDPLRQRLWAEYGLPTEYEYVKMSPARRQLDFGNSNYVVMRANFSSHGHYFPEQKRWVTNPWGQALAGVPWPEEVKRDHLRAWSDRTRRFDGPDGAQLHRWLDTMSYEHYLTKVMGLRVEVARYWDDFIASNMGLGSDVTSAYAAWKLRMPGFRGLYPGNEGYRDPDLNVRNTLSHSFPGGNDGIARVLVKKLVPEAIAGGAQFAEVYNGKVNFAALDRPGQATRIRLGSTVVSVSHVGARDKTQRVAVVYIKDGRPHRVHARRVIVASGAWAAKHMIRDLPESHRVAMQQFYRSPVLVVNVALNNWRALYNLGYTAASWRGGFGFTFSLRNIMKVGEYAPELDPDKPNVLTYYVTFPKVGLPVQTQGAVGRAEMLSRSYRDYERIVRTQLTEMLGPHGFDARRDIAGIILNRWGHAYVDTYPGFFFGREGQLAPREIASKPVGSISFANAELQGFQNWNNACGEGQRAAEEALG